MFPALYMEIIISRNALERLFIQINTTYQSYYFRKLWFYMNLKYLYIVAATCT